MSYLLKLFYRFETKAYQSLPYEFLNSFGYTFFVTRPKYILCHIQCRILTTTVLKQIFRVLWKSYEKETNKTHGKFCYTNIFSFYKYNMRKTKEIRDELA